MYVCIHLHAQICIDIQFYSFYILYIYIIIYTYIYIHLERERKNIYVLKYLIHKYTYILYMYMIFYTASLCDYVYIDHSFNRTFLHRRKTSRCPGKVALQRQHPDPMAWGPVTAIGVITIISFNYYRIIAV